LALCQWLKRKVERHTHIVNKCMAQELKDFNVWFSLGLLTKST
jgi:hypothetical protein